MHSVYVAGPPAEVLPLINLGNRLQNCFQLLAEQTEPEPLVELRQTLDEQLIHVSRRKVLVSLDQSEPISRYACLPRPLYVLACTMLGLVYWRSLVINPLLVWEDFFVREDPECLCAARSSLQEYALAFERPAVCPACVEFFRCLGAQPEVEALQRVLDHLILTQQRSTILSR